MKNLFRVALLAVVMMLPMVLCAEKDCSKDFIKPEERVDCGYYGIDQEKCENSDHNEGLCCWVESEQQGVPWCYYGVKTEKTCDMDVNSRFDCGYLGITRDQCESPFHNKGRCCWDDSQGGAPYCFHGATDLKPDCPEFSEPPANRTDCGWYGINDKECTDSSHRLGLCCWGETDVNGAPWCYYGVKKTLWCSKEYIREQDRHECGWYGITQEQCADRSCCWQESEQQGVPWCYNGIPGAEA